MSLKPLPSPAYYPVGVTDPKEALAILTREIVDRSIIFTLQMTNQPDNRLTPDLLGKCVLPALDDIEREWRADKNGKLEGGPGTGQASLITTGLRDKDKFYSNGLDLQLALATPGFFTDVFHRCLGRILTFPIPTVAAINGHCFAGGLTFALSHDYKVFKAGEGRTGALCAMNEIDFGAPLPTVPISNLGTPAILIRLYTGMMAILKAKLSPSTLRHLCLGNRVSGQEVITLGIADVLGNGGEEVYKKSLDIAKSLAPKAKSGVWGIIKEGMYKETLAELPLEFSMDMSVVEEEAITRLGPEPKGRSSKL